MSTREQVSILLVDDQPARLLAYAAILDGLGQRLVKVTSGVAALEALMKEEFAVILLDVSMPDMDGFETAAMIHQHPRFEKTPIIFVTGLHVTDLDRLRGYELGAVDYVYVPVVPEILRSKVAVLVELHCKRRELQRVNQSLEQANADLALANSTLVAEKTRELEALNRTLQEANTGLALANRALEGEIAERKRLDEAVRESARLKDEFLALLAHELRNPLAPILNAVEILRTKKLEDKEMIWSRGVIERQASHLTRLVDDLLDVNRITQGKIKLQKEPIELTTIVTRATEISRPLIDARHHEFTVELPAQTLWVEGDLARLAQVVGNLLNNAAKSTEDGGRILLRVEEQKREGVEVADVVIRVRDTGMGIPPELLPRVFDLFTQAERTVDRSQGGLGIGLALVRRLVDLHGGSVSAHSDAATPGSEFVVRLPGLDPHARAAQPAMVQPPQYTIAPGLRVLVVDDNVDSAEGLAMLLRTVGAEVQVAHDGMTALPAAERLRAEVVLLDIGMPQFDGYEVARWMRAQAWGKDVLVVAVTGWGQEAARRKAQESGFDAHLVKPVDFAALMKVLSRVTTRSSHDPMNGASPPRVTA